MPESSNVDVDTCKRGDKAIETYTYCLAWQSFLQIILLTSFLHCPHASLGWERRRSAD